ncbi:MAG: PKD domain-containing protein [Bacteroidota bacterium]
MATHIVGGELNYQYLGNNVYRIWLTVYRDCYNGVPPFDNPASVGVFDAGNNALVFERLLPRNPSDTIPSTINSPCFIPPTNVCYERTTYSDTITLPPNSQGYILSYQRCCRNVTILNIIDPTWTGATYLAYIPPTSIFPINGNPKFNNWPPPFICAGIPFIFDNSATDPDGDSIAYEICAPYLGADTIDPMPQPPNPPPYSSVVWQPPYSASNILNGNPNLSIDVHSGLLTCTPNTLGQFVVGVCAKEFRNGVYVSTTKRDFQLNVVPCPSYVVAAIQNPIINCENYNVSFQNYSVNAGSYLWDFGLPGNTDQSAGFSPNFTYPDTGTYQVTLIAYSSINTACADTTTGTVTILPLFNTYANYTRDVCTNTYHFSDSSNTVSGLIATRNWTFGDGDTSTAMNPTHTYSSAGNYIATLITTSTRGCKDTVRLTINVPPLVQANNPIITLPTCHNDSNAIIAVQVSGGNAPYYLQWNDPHHQQTTIIDSLYSGTYTLIITDAAGCKDTSTYTINNPPVLTFDTLTTNAYCKGECIGSASAILVNGGVPGYSFMWSDNNHQSSATATHLCPGNYSVTVTDQNGCSKVISNIVINSSDSLPYFDAYCDDTTLYQGQSTLLHCIPDSSINNYSWMPNQYLSNSSIANPTATPPSTITYVATMTDANGCSVMDTVIIEVAEVLCAEPEVFVPNAFSPNNDGQNEILYVRGNAIKTMLLRVYDRWGELVFESNNKNNGWNGTYKNNPVDPGVFVYYLEVVCYDNQEYFKKGNITVIR